MSPVQVEAGNFPSSTSAAPTSATSRWPAPTAASTTTTTSDARISSTPPPRDQTVGRRSGGLAEAAHRSEGTLGLCSVDCPPNSVDLTVFNFGLTRITMDQIHEIIKDVEDLKYNDAQFQMNNELRTGTPDQEGRLFRRLLERRPVRHLPQPVERPHRRVRRFAAPARTASATVLTINPSASNALFKGSLALLPASERVLIEQTDWSEVKNINPYAVFEKPDASVEITRTSAGAGRPGSPWSGRTFNPTRTT